MSSLNTRGLDTPLVREILSKITTHSGSVTPQSPALAPMLLSLIKQSQLTMSNNSTHTLMILLAMILMMKLQRRFKR